jgi:hypothetical protein
MSIIGDVRTYLKTYSGLESGAPVWVGYLSPAPTEYAVVSIAGGKIIETYLNGASLREFPFAFQSMESTADDLERLETLGFYEAFAAWLESQTETGVLPTLTGTPSKTPVLIEATSWGYLCQQGQSETGVYQIVCRLTYDQAAP